MMFQPTALCTKAQKDVYKRQLFTYCVTSVQLALAYPSAQGGVTASAVKFLGIFAPTQLPLAVIEGILTVVVVIALESFAKSELKAIDFEIEEEKE